MLVRLVREMDDAAHDTVLYKVIEKVAKQVNKKHDIEAAIPGKSEVSADVAVWVPTASVLLNLLLGNDKYGIAAGRIFEIFGDNSHGKSTLAQIIMNAFQALGGVSVLLDSESSWNRVRAIAMGHNPQRHLAVDIETCEMGFDVTSSIVEEFKLTLKGKVPVVIVWDTIAASPTDDEKKGDEYASGMGFKPRLIRRELRRLTPELKKIQASMVFVNQTIESMKPNRSGVKTTPGGGGIKFWASQRLQVTKVSQYARLENKKERAGIISEVKVVKSKLNPPFQSVDIPINFETGVDPIREVVNYLHDHTSVYNTSGAYRRIVGYGEEDITCYEKDIPSKFKEHPGLFDWMVEQVKSHWLTGETF